MRSYPDISDLLARKAEGRRGLSELTFGEKIARMEALRERLEPFKRARELRKSQGAALGPAGGRGPPDPR